jgi:hypothetical protein
MIDIDEERLSIKELQSENQKYSSSDSDSKKCWNRHRPNAHMPPKNAPNWQKLSKACRLKTCNWNRDCDRNKISAMEKSIVGSNCVSWINNFLLSWSSCVLKMSLCHRNWDTAMKFWSESTYNCKKNHAKECSKA